MAGNPIVPNVGLNDPHIRIFNDTAYVYASHDKSADNRKFTMEDWWVWSSPDLVNWTKRSVLKPEDTYIGKPYDGCWATDAAEKNGKYYWYFSERNKQSGVVVGESPVGPWVDPLGKPLLPEDLTPTHEYDMSIIEDDGSHYIVFGVWDYYIAKLGDDMISLAEAPRKIDIINPRGPYNLDGNNKKMPTDDKPFLHQHEGKYYLSWGCFYATSDHLYGPYKYQDAILQPESFAYGYDQPTWPNGFRQGRHGSFFEWHNQTYFVYCDISQTGNRWFRDAFISYVQYKDNGQIAPIRVDRLGVGQYCATDTIEAEEYFAAENLKKKEWQKGFAVTQTAKESQLFFQNVKELEWLDKVRIKVSGNGDYDISIVDKSKQEQEIGHLSFKLDQEERMIEIPLNLNSQEGNIDIKIKKKSGLPLTIDFLKFAGSDDYQDPSLPIEKRVEDLLSKMSVEEKVAQMRIFHANKGVEMGDDDKMKLSQDVISRLAYGIAGIKNPGEHISPVRAAKLNNELQKYIIENNRWGIPALFVTESYNGVDAEGCTVFGRPITFAASWNPELVKREWDVVGREARLRGMHMCHSPEADIVRDPRFGRMSEAFGEDTYLVRQMVTSAIKGVQGDYEGLGEVTHIGAVAKHFAGYGQVLGGTNFAAIEISPRTLIDEIFPPFEAAVKEARALGIMASHGDLNGIASHANPWLLREVLRDQWRFKGYTVSDANDIARLYFFMNVAESAEQAALLGLKAGMDVDLYSDEAYILLPEMAKRDPELITYIDQAAGNVLRTKFILSLFENPYIDLEHTRNGVRTEKALALAKEADLESIILLKNENAILPLAPHSAKKIALLGPILDEDTAEAWRRIAGKETEIISKQGFRLTDENRSVPQLLQTTEEELASLVSMAAEADVVVLYLGGDEHTSKEAFFNNALGDRGTIEPLGKQDELIRRVKNLGKPVIVILKHRRTLAINEISKHADAILDCWDLSEFGDESIARLVFGEVSPSGKLPVTVPRNIGQLPFHYSSKEINRKKEYLFLDQGPLYPFGFGLSYSEFKYSNLNLSSETLDPDGFIQVTVEVTNTGTMEAREVVQMYVKDEIGSVLRPDKELKAFDKVSLKPGETKKITFQIQPEMLKFTGISMKKILEPGDYTVQVGPSSQEGLIQQFKLVK